MELKEVKLPDIEKIKQEAIEKSVAYKEKSKAEISHEVIALKEHISKILLPEAVHQEAHQHSQALKNLPDETKISKLIELAFEKGPLTAIEIAKKMNDAYILDALHDILSKDELFYKLVALGKI